VRKKPFENTNFILMQSFKISPYDAGVRLERFLKKTFPQIPLASLQKFLRTKKVALLRHGERQKIENSLEILQNDEIRIFFDPDAFTPLPPKRAKDFSAILKNPKFQDLRIAYEDEHLMVIEKPAGVAVHPGSKVQFGHSLVDFCIARERTKNPECPEPKLAHRLDKDTSGLIIVAKNDAVLRKVVEMVQDGSIKKEYLALVRGNVTPKKGSIRDSLQKTEGSKHTKILVSEDGKRSVTHYEVDSYFPAINASLVRVVLETGRMHQIRVHFAEKGHPLAGDDAYGGFAWNRDLKKQFGLARQFLHAHQLTFTHPISGKPLKITSPLPKDLEKVVGK